MVTAFEAGWNCQAEKITERGAKVKKEHCSQSYYFLSSKCLHIMDLVWPIKCLTFESGLRSKSLLNLCFTERKRLDTDQ